MSDGHPDQKIVAMQRQHEDGWRLAEKWIIVHTLEGYEVHHHLIDGVGPPSVYPTRDQAAARILQLLKIKQPVTPQNWPERIQIGAINGDPLT
jgi:hypothetical protein